MTTLRYPTSSSNPKITSDPVFIVHETYGMSEDSCETVYIDGQGQMWRVGSERYSAPVAVSLFQVCRITGENEEAIRARFERWKIGIEEAMTA